METQLNGNNEKPFKFVCGLCGKPAESRSCRSKFCCKRCGALNSHLDNLVKLGWAVRVEKKPEISDALVDK